MSIYVGLELLGIGDHIPLPLQCVRRIHFSTSSPTPVVSAILTGHLGGHEVVLHCGFDLYFPND
jgi:hypothetical protein